MLSCIGDYSLLINMKRHLIFNCLLIALLAAGGYGVLSIIQTDNSPSDIAETEQEANVKSIPQTTEEQNTASEANRLNSSQQSVNLGTKNSTASEVISSDNLIKIVTDLLDEEQYLLAVDQVDSQYRQLSSNQFEQFQELFINTASRLKRTGQTDQAITLLTAFNDSFNDLDGWVLLSDIYITRQNHSLAIDTLLKATALEFRPEELSRLMTNLTSAASHVKYSFETQKNELAINELYRKLFESHPDNARFQLELAMSYLRLEDTVTSRELLESLQYDAELGEIARTSLALLNKQQEPPPAAPEPEKRNRNEIVVPLLRSGNSFFVDATINNRPLRLLLDTGASITSLSQSTIDRLGLEPSGRGIQLSTANGTRRSELFQTERIRLGRLSVNNLLVASIDLGNNSRIDGLLGTDLLNQIDSRYSYVIDNQRNALIFINK